MVTKCHFLECYSFCNHCTSLTKLIICLYLSVSISVLNQKFWKTLQTFWKLRSGQVLCIIWCAMIPTQLNVCFCLYRTKKLQVIFYGIDTVDISFTINPHLTFSIKIPIKDIWMLIAGIGERGYSQKIAKSC